MRRLCLLLPLALAACVAPSSPVVRAPGAIAPLAKVAYARALAPKDVPAAIMTQALGPAQAAADEASRRRDIDFFALPSNPVGLAVGGGFVLSFLGTARHDAELDIELRALVAGDQVGVTMNYSGATTLGRGFAGPGPSIPASRDAIRFELITGLPGGQVTDAYGDYLNPLGEQLRRRYDARPFSFDDVPLVFAVHQGDAVTGFVFTNQGNQLVLGDRKYADVQNVACVTADGRLAAAYTIVGFNQKTPAPAAAPTWTIERDARFGLMAVCGEF